MALFKLANNNFNDTVEHADLYIFGIYSDQGLTDEFQEQHPNISKQINMAMDKGEFKAKLNQAMLMYTPDCSTASRYLAMGMGEAEKFTPDFLRQIAATAAQKVIGVKGSSIAVEFMGEDKLAADESQALVEGLVMGGYRFLNYQKQEGDYKGITDVTVVSNADLGAELEYGMKVAEGVVLARDLGNHPSNFATPTYLAETAEQIAKEGDMKITVYEREDFEKLGFGGIQGVAQGSDVPPKFIILEYNGGGSDSKTLGLVGKGLTFDSGGISIKPAAGMDEMKFDMLGGAAVLGIMSAVAQIKPKLNIVAIVPSAENMSGSKAYKPGDILTAYNGKTIEILNTDAEGRLILADGLSYITKHYELDGLVDFATLTGAVIIALGHRYSAVLTNDQPFADELMAVGEKVQDRIWQLPLDEEYTEDIKSKIADVKNTGAARQAGTIAAGAFLQEFVAEGTPWCHVDIAGSGWLKKGRPYQPEGPTGSGVRLILELIKSWE